MAETIHTGEDIEKLAKRPIMLRRSKWIEVVPCRLRDEQHFSIERKWPNEKDRSQYYRLTERQYFILCALNGQSTLAEIQKRYKTAFGEELDLEEIESFVSSLYRNGLAESSQPGGSGELFRPRPKERSWWQDAYRNLFSVRIPIVDPDRLLSAMNRSIGWIFSGPAVTACLFVVFAALVAIFTNYDLVRQRLPEFHEFFGMDNWGYLIAAVIITKIFHEMGHGLCAKRYGYGVREMGAMFIVGMPVLYCDVRETHMEPDKWKRIKVASAGVYVELVIAAICAFIWLRTSTGLMNHLCLAIMFTASVNTLVFNLNPLMRFDGHYVLAYWWERPELRTESSQYLQAKLGWLLMGRDGSTPWDKEPDAFWLGAYALASALYRWWVVFRILIFIYHVFQPYGLGGMIVCIACYKLIVQPIAGFAVFLLPSLKGLLPARRPGETVDVFPV